MVPPKVTMQGKPNPSRANRFARTLFGVVLLGLVFAIVLVYSAGGPAEPTVRGVSLTEWLRKTSRLEVGEGIAEIGPAAIPFLIQHVEAEETRWTSAYRRFWPRMPVFLKKWLARPRNLEAIRENAFQGLREFGEEAKPALPAILAYLSHTNTTFNKSVAMEAALSIDRNDPAVSVAFRRFMADPVLRRSATVAIYNTTYYPDGIITALLPFDLGDTKNPPFNELLAVSVMGEDAAPAVALLVDGLNNPEIRQGRVLGNLLTAISGIGPAAAPAVPALVKMLESSNAHERGMIAKTLMNMGPAAATAEQRIGEMLDDEDAGLRAIAAATLVRIGASPDGAIPVLIDCLTNRSDTGSVGISPIRSYGLDHYGFNTPMTSAWLLGEVAPHSKEALPVLKDVLLSEYPGWLKVVVARSIWQLEGDTDSVLPALRGVLTDPANEVRVIACITLGEMGAAAKSAIPDLEAACKLSLNTRRAALEAIALISGD